jgi:hypothetical protein
MIHCTLLYNGGLLWAELLGFDFWKSQGFNFIHQNKIDPISTGLKRPDREADHSFYIHEPVHRNKFLFNNQPDALIIQIYSVIKLQFHPDSAWKRSSNLHETYQCRMYSGKLLMMGREDARNT